MARGSLTRCGQSGQDLVRREDPARTTKIYDANKSLLKSNKPEDAIGAGIVLKVPKSVAGGTFIDHMAADTRAKPRTTKTDPNVPQDHVWPGEESAPKNQHGSKAAKTIAPASLKDTPASSGARQYTFETVARSDDTGTYYGTMHWTFKTHETPGKVTDESWHVTEGVSHTFKGALDEFNKFYKNTHTVMAGDTLESIAARYLGSAAKADDIYKANTALIPDKTKLTPGIQLVIPGLIMRLCWLLGLGLACGHAQKEGPMNSQIQDQIAALDNDADELHADRTPAVARLIELGESALVPLYDQLDNPDHLHRQRAQRAVEGITRRSFGFDGRAWPDGALDRWTAWWSGIGYDAEAAPPDRAAAIARLRQWSRARP